MAVQRTIAIHIAGRIGRRHGFSAEDAGHSDLLAITGCAMVFAQAIAQLRQQRIVGRQSEIIHIHFVRMALTASRPDRDVQSLLGSGPGRDGRFGLHLITRINHRINGLRKQPRPIVCIHELLHAVDAALRMYLRNPIAHCKNLGLADGIGKRMDLAIDVRLGHVVEVNQRDLPYPTARQGFSSPRAHPPDTHHHHMRPADTPSALYAIQPFQSAKATLQRCFFNTPCRGLQRRFADHYFNRERRSLAATAASDCG